MAGFIQGAFNSSYVSEGKVKLTVVNHDGTTNYEDVYNNHMMVGQFDLGFGSISGNSLDPLNFLEVLKSDNSSGFTLNWGPDTSVVSENLIYNDQPWSFDTLWQAGDSFVVAQEGVVTPLFTLLSSAVELLPDGRLQVVIEAKEIDSEDITTMIYALALYGCTDSKYLDYEEIWVNYDDTTFLHKGPKGELVTQVEGVNSSYDVVVDEEGISTYTIIFDADALAYMVAAHPDFYVAGIDIELYTSIASLDFEVDVFRDGYFTTIVEYDAWPSLPEPAPAPFILD